MSSINVQDFVDTTRYPLDAATKDYRDMVADIHNLLAVDGCAVLRGFIRPERIADLVREADSVAMNGHRSFNRTNAYFTKDDPNLPENHPMRRFFDRSNAFVPADNFGAESILRAIYEWQPFAPFIKDALGEEKFYRYADPLADVIINTVEEGEGFPWHFDTNNYTVTLAIQNGESGGEFDYCPNVRTAVDENFDDVQAVLDNRHDGIETLELGAGDLQIFKGRYSLHRVRPVKGARKRYVAIFSFVEEPGMVGSPERTRQLYGRVLPIHLERAGQRADTLVD
ncbi:MAG: HalD/BesD family halogenase [Hyphomicrobiales bacterium]